MKGKLIKTDVNYILEDDKGVVIASTSLKRVEGLSLSLKNCQAIELGYDLDELISNHLENNHIEAQTRRVDVIKLLILEILSDKKFSEEDIIKAIKLARIKDTNPKNTSAFLTLDEEIIQSLQQTWDVEIEKEFIFDPAMGISQGYNSDKPKLDSNGNLILKRL
jgi:hypothetical protein